jgi:flavorubredoxin
MWPLPRGIAYNAYVVEGEKIALIDTVKGPWFKDYFEKVKSVIGDRKVSYLIINHMEPDHSEAIVPLRLAYPEMILVGNAKTLPLLNAYYGGGNTMEVKDGEELDLGGHRLVFRTIPMVHWPESMVTYDAATKLLFSNDAFGGYGAHEGGLFDDQKPRERWEDEMLRYFSTIVGKYAAPTQSALKKLAGMELAMILPSHGTLFRKDVAKVVELYDRWSRCDTARGAVVAYGSMYGHTAKMAEAVCRGLVESGVTNTCLYDAARADPSFMLRDIWRYKAVALLSCTYNLTLFPPMESLCSKLLNRKPKNHVLAIAGSYSWSRGALDALRKFSADIGWETLQPQVEVLASPTPRDLDACVEMGRALAEAMAR